MPRREAVDRDLRRVTAPRRRFPGWAGRRSALPPLVSIDHPCGHRLTCEGTDLAHARRVIGDLLTRWALAPTDVAAVRLVVSELVSHVVTHDGAGRIEVMVAHRGEQVTVVVDYERARAHRLHESPSPVAPGTLGLTVVGRIAPDWGHVEAGTDGRYWAVVPTPRGVLPSRVAAPVRPGDAP